MKKDLLWPSAPGGGADVPVGIAGHVRGAALQDQDGRVAPMVSILGAPTKFRDAFETFDTTTRWNAVQIAPGDIVQADGNVAGASYLVISKDPLSEASETVIETLDSFTMPVSVAAGISLSQRINGQEFSLELVSTDDWPGVVPLVPASPVAIASISQATTTLSVTTAAPHGLRIGERVSVFGVPDGRLNYSCITVATTPTPTSFTATAGPQGAIPSVTVGPFTRGSIIKADPLGYARNGSSLVFEGATATNESYYVRSEGGDALALSLQHTEDVNPQAGAELTSCPRMNLQNHFILSHFVDGWPDIDRRLTFQSVVNTSQIQPQLRQRSKPLENFIVSPTHSLFGSATNCDIGIQLTFGRPASPLTVEKH